MPRLRVLHYSSHEAVAPIQRIRDRFNQQLSQASAVASEKTVELFGEPLSPVESVRRIVEDVRLKGEEAVLDYAYKLDKTNLSSETLLVPESEINAALEQISSDFEETLILARENIRRFQQHIKISAPPDIHIDNRQLGVIYRPLDSVGLYIPGGSAAYPSTVLMTAIPAIVAGVKRIVMVCLPGTDGKYPPEILAAAHISGIKEIYRVGGVHAVAALAFGTKTIPKVDKIVGPGNLFVMLAKREILGASGIDLLAGPSEVIVLADDSAEVAFVAADLLAQAEHDPMASSILVTTSSEFAKKVAEEVDTQLEQLSRSEIAEASIKDYGLAVITKDIEEAVKFINECAPEHLEILTEDARSIAGEIRHAGAIFIGPHTPEPVGDYLAGPSHVLPTGGTARFFSGLSVNDFLKRTSLIEYSAKALQAESDHIQRFAEAEGLDGHAKSIEARVKKTL